MQYQLIIEKRAQKDLDRIPTAYKDKFTKAFLALTDDPFMGKKLDGDLKGNYSLRVWPYRVIYRVYKKQLIVSVVYIGHRQGVY